MKKSKQINCEKVQEGINDYINHKLPDRELEEFIRHVRSCPDCFEELETYYIVSITMQYLDDEKEESYNITRLLADDLTKNLLKLKRKKRLRLLFSIIGGILLFSLSVGSLLWI